MKLKKISLREREELEPLLMKNPEVIEEGLRVIAHQHPTDSGPLDILAVDSDGTLVVAELKNEASESHLDQGLRYYDWCCQNLAWIAQSYKNFNIDSSVQPRLFLVAPSFTEDVQRIAKYVNAELQLFEYQAVENEKGEHGLICNSVDFGQPVEAPEIPTLEKKMEYFQDNKVRELFKSLLAELEAKGHEVKPVRGRWVSVWYKGKRFMYMGARRAFFVVQVLTLDGSWSNLQRVTKREDWESVEQNYVKKYIQHLESA